MPRMTPVEMGIANLRGDFPPEAIGFQQPELAHAFLVKQTGVDFGMDAVKWQTWLDNNPEKIASKVSSIQDARNAARAMKPKSQSETAGQ